MVNTKYIFTVGGVLSGLGKGIFTSSLGMLLQQSGFSVTAIKIDPYINLDAGTMRPTEHGEIFVTKDGGETDQDIGQYERFLNIDLPKLSNITTGQIYQSIIDKERKLLFKGRDVEMFPVGERPRVFAAPLRINHASACQTVILESLFLMVSMRRRDTFPPAVVNAVDGVASLGQSPAGLDIKRG